MKTIRTPREILEQGLPKEVAQRAIANAEQFPFGEGLLNDPDEAIQTVHETLATTFSWYDSNEGEQYWRGIYEGLKEQGI